MEKSNYEEINKENRAWFADCYPNKFFSSYVQVVFNDELSGFGYFDFKRGKKIDNLPKEAIFKVNKVKKATKEFILSWDLLPNSTVIMLVNEKALKVLHEVAEGEFQEIPAKIYLQDGELIEGYKYINIIQRKEVLNKEKSIVDPDVEEGAWNMYKTCYYDKDCLGESNLVRPDDSIGNLLVSEKFKQACEREKLKGIEFLDSYIDKYFILD